jgi:hypothetical protein
MEVWGEGGERERKDFPASGVYLLLEIKFTSIERKNIRNLYLNLRIEF